MTIKSEMHPRNRHRTSYDFKELVKSCSELAEFVIFKHDNQSIDFSNPRAVKLLNQAILKSFYGITWDLPDQFLCPPIPSRADYIHHVADLLSSSNKGVVPRGKHVLVLDIGVGANCIYPLIGHREYGWSFLGTEINPLAISVAQEIIQQNKLSEVIKIRLQKSPTHIFKGVVKDEILSVSMCNPPFHSSRAEAESGTKRKWKNLKIETKTLNFGGQSNELICPGGEVAFIKRMIEESVDVNCNWFTTLVSKASSLPSIYAALKKVNPAEVRTIEMSQGQKQSRIVAWAFKIG